MRHPNTDSALWTTRPVHGVAGGPVEVVLTEEGLQRAFSVGAQVRRGPPSNALSALAALGGRAALSERVGSRMRATDLGHIHMHAWSVLLDLGLVERWHSADGDGVSLTSAGERAVANGHSEQARLLERCKRAAGVAS